MVEPKPSGGRPRALPSAVLLCSVLFFLPGVFAYPYQAMSPTGYMCQGWYAEMYSYDSISPQDCQALCSDSSNCGAMTFQGADGSVGRDYSVCACSTARPLLSFAVVARQRAHLVASIQQSAHDMSAHVARGAGDGDAHAFWAACGGAAD